jgi:hypothetical protein
VHDIFAIAIGANTVSASFQICIPTTFVDNPVTLSPLTGIGQIGASYTLTASVVDALGNGIFGVPVTFNVSNTNTATGTNSTDSNGMALFGYSGTNVGLDNIIASVTGATSNTVSAQWQGVVNQPPTANAGLDQIVEATSPSGASVVISGAGSSDPDGDTLTYSWTGPFAPISGMSITPVLPLGVSVVTLTVDDGHGHQASTTVKITVRDTTPPVVTPPAAITIPATEAAGARSSLSPSLAAFLAGGSAIDIADSAPARLSPVASGANIDGNTLFPLNSSTAVQFRFADASGNVGSVVSTVSVILGQPRLYAKVVAQGRTAGALFADVQFTNTGTGNARNLTISQIAFRTLSGTGTVSLNSTSVPIALGSLDVGTSTTVRLFLNVPSTVTRFGVIEGGTVNDVIGTNYSFSVAQALVP